MDQVAVQPVNPNKKVGYGWVVFIVTFFAAWTASSNMAKVTALAPILMPYFGISPDAIGWIIAAFYIMGFVLAFPVAWMIPKIGLRFTVALAVVCGVVGGLMGVLSTDLPMFIVSRVIEGAGMGFMNVAGASALFPWFPGNKRGLAFGLWGMWVASAMFICPTLYSALVDQAGWSWQGIWWMMIVFDVVVLILFMVFYRDAPEGWNGEPVEANATPVKHATKLVFMIPALWALGLCFFFDEAAYMAINGFFSTYLTSDNVGATLTVAGLIASGAAVLGAIFAPISGKLSDVLHTRKWVLLVGLLAGFLYTCLVFTSHSVEAYYGIIILGGIAGGFVPALVMTIAPELAGREELVPSANALVCFFQNTGMFVGAMFMGNAIVAFGWTMATWVVLIPCYIIAICCLLIGLRKVK